MKINAARQFILKNARPIDLAVYKYFFENGSNQRVIDELSKFQNEDGGFGNGLEPDFLNPNSSPIATNDAIITLYRTDALECDSDIVKGIVRYLKSHDSFDEDKKRWLFAIDSNKDYPHAIWWEKKDDGISGFNPTISLATFMFCYGERTIFYEDIIRDGFKYLEDNTDIKGDEIKCYLLSYELLKSHEISEIINLEDLKELISKRINDVICRDINKYGIEYVHAPSDFFAGHYLEFITSEIEHLVHAEKEILGKLQKEDGGFDIWWKWYTPYSEFEQARKYWRPRVTIDKLLFVTGE
ncbi:MAG: hypothetical protein GX283_10035 [Clostridiaceae bacterium]|jgi:hypothetical protein|nr:hypothetical protein [Clostridiaceae bacterium]